MRPSRATPAGVQSYHDNSFGGTQDMLYKRVCNNTSPRPVPATKGCEKPHSITQCSLSLFRIRQNFARWSTSMNYLAVSALPRARSTTGFTYGAFHLSRRADAYVSTPTGYSNLSASALQWMRLAGGRRSCYGTLPTRPGLVRRLSR
jgi:hypothetical protein